MAANFGRDVRSGDTRRALAALRDRLALEIEAGAADPAAVASLSGRLITVLERLDARPAPKKGTVLDELAHRRSDGGGVTARPARARRG